MARLPVPGSDSDTWGDVLNEFLLEAHDSSGALKAGSVGAAQVQGGVITDVHVHDSAEIAQTKIAGLPAALAAKADDAAAVRKGTLAINVKDAPYNAKGDGMTDDTAAIQAAISAAEASGASSRNVHFPKGIYRITDTIMVQGATGLHIAAYGATIRASLSAGKAAIEMKTTPADYAKGRRTVIEGLTITSQSVGVGVGIFVNYAHEWYLHNIYVEYFEAGIRVYESYYGGIGGYSVLLGNTVGIDIPNEEVNTLDLHNIKINGAGKLAGATSYGIRSGAIMHSVKFYGLTIEGYDYGFMYNRQTYSNSIIQLDQVYFEAIATCAIEFSTKAGAAGITADLTNLHFAENNKAAWLKITGNGVYKFYTSTFQQNRIYVKNDSTFRISLDTDVPVSQIDFAVTQATGAGDGLVQVNGRTAGFVDGNVYLYNTRGDYNTYPRAKSHLPSIVDASPIYAISPFDENQIGRIYPALTVNHRDVVFEKGGVVLKSPAGNYFRLTVDDSGVLTTKNVTAIKRTFAPSLSTISALEVGRREVRGTTYVLAEGATFTVLETGRKATKASGVINDTGYSGRVFGTTAQAAMTSFGGIYYVPYYWDTDIEYFYCWQGTYWGWAGTGPLDATNIRAIGTLAQRPAAPVVTYMQYYATDNTTRYTWNGSAWS